MAEKIKENTEKEKTHDVIEDTENISPSQGRTKTRESESGEILSSLKENTTLLHEIKEVIQNKLEYDAVKEKAFDKLYEEMRRQKEASDLQDRAVKPVLSDLLLLYDSMKKFEKSMDIQSIKENEILQNFRYLIEELLEILYRQEVLPIEENTSDIFNSKIHKATKTENAESMDDNFKIVNIVRNGFTWRDKVLRPQEVIIKRFLNKF